jgi:hypothetical protein
MADISRIKLPSGNYYDIKDAVARQMIAGGISFVIAWNGSSTPVVANIPAGVVVKYNGTNYTGTLAASADTIGKFYLIKSTTQIETLDVYDEYATMQPTSSTYAWEKIGDTSIDLSSLKALAYKDVVELAIGGGADVLGASTTFTAGSSSVSFGTHTTKKAIGSSATFTVTQPTISVTPSTTNIKATASGTAVGANGTANAITGFGAHTTGSALGADATFTTTVTPATTNIKATATGAAVGADGTDTFVKSYPGATSKLVKGNINEVTGVTEHINTFTMGTDEDAETLIIGSTTGAATLTTSAKSFATGALAANGGGDSVMTGLGTATTASALTGVKVTSQPTISLTTGATAGTGVIAVATGINSATTTANDKDTVTAITALGTPTTAAALTGVKVTTQPTVALATGATAGTGVISVATGISSASASGGNVAFNSKDEVTAITGLGTATAAAPTITVGNNNKVKVAEYEDISGIDGIAVYGESD